MRSTRGDKGKIRKAWTEDEHLCVEKIVLDALARDVRKINWKQHLDIIGHSYDSVIARACDIRNAARIAGVEKTLKEVRTENRQRQAENNQDSIESHRTNTSTAVLRFDAEIRARVTEKGVTAGLLGDPVRGRSALDRKRAGIVEPRVRHFGEDRSIKKPTLASKPLDVWGPRADSRVRQSSARKPGASPKPNSLARKTDRPEVACE